jgi:uridine phosphorylase
MTSLNSCREVNGELIHVSLESSAVNHDQPIHLRPTATLAERVLLPGDPGRALALAQFLLSEPLMFNHHRGLWGYTGAAADEQPLTIQSTGMGGPSAAIVLHELISLGVTRAIRVGTCGALDAALGLGDLVAAREAIAADGTSAALTSAASGALARTHAHAGLADRLSRVLSPEAHADGRGGACVGARPTHLEATIVSTDLFYEPNPTRNRDWSDGGAIAVEMEASALFAVGASAGIQVACVLAVTDTFDAEGARTRIDDHALVEAVEAMGTVAAAALAD